MNGELGIGETLERQQRVARSRRRRILYVWLIVVLGIGGGILDSRPFAAATGVHVPIPTWVLTPAVMWIVLIALEVWDYTRGSYDEFELAKARFACCFAVIAFAFAYPIWCLLWVGNLVAEPEHDDIAVALFVAYNIGYYWKRYR